MSYNILFPIICAVLLQAAGIVQNDIHDAEIDKGRAEKPIASGHIKKNDAMVFGALLFVAAMAVAGLSMNYVLVLAAGMAAILGSAYNSKRFGLWGNILVAMVPSSYGILGWGGYTHQIFDLRLLFVLVAYYFAGLSMGFTANFYDYKTEMKRGGKTLPIIYGVKKAAAITTLTRYLAIISCILLLANAELIHPVTVAMIIVLSILAAIVHKCLLGSEERKNAKKAFKITILFSNILFLAIIAGVFLK
jgi:4-hydroxybenzoate polyprenyltransferase